MKIALITLHTPTATNFRGASALPYHLAKFRDKSIEMEVWTFNNNECSQEQICRSEHELGVKIHLIPLTKRLRLLKTALLRLVLSYPFQYYIKLPDTTVTDVKNWLGASSVNNGVWFYGEELAHHITKFDGYKRVVTTPDCEAMYYYRMLAEQGVPLSYKNLIRYNLMYHRYAKMASEFPKGDNIKYHLVGKEDACFLKKLNQGIDARFIRHPHYDVDANISLDKNGCSSRKIRLLIAGRYDVYMSKAVDEAIIGMISIKDEIRDNFHITFLGKDWDKSANDLIDAGFSVEKKGYVEDYVAEVSSHDIQLTPISVGTGTKGKVLDAFANGLMVMGTLRALENVAVESGVSCVQYESAEDLADWLVKLAYNPTKVAEIAKAGNEAVMKLHGREVIAKVFFGLFV